MIRIEVDLNSPVPAYQQVIQAVKIETLAGRLKDGDRLPRSGSWPRSSSSIPIP